MAASAFMTSLGANTLLGVKVLLFMAAAIAAWRSSGWIGRKLGIEPGTSLTEAAVAAVRKPLGQLKRGAPQVHNWAVIDAEVHRMLEAKQVSEVRARFFEKLKDNVANQGWAVPSDTSLERRYASQFLEWKAEGRLQPLYKAPNQ